MKPYAWLLVFATFLLASSGFAQNDDAVLNPEGDCSDGDYAVLNPDECVQESLSGDEDALLNPEADLAPGTVTFVTDTITSLGIVYEFSSTIENIGRADAGSFAVEWYVDGRRIMRAVINGIASGGSEVSKSWWTAAQGTHTVEIRVDVGDEVSELLEANNVQSLGFDFGVPEIIEVIDCRDADFALLNPELCGVGAVEPDCSDDNFAVLNPEKCVAPLPACTLDDWICSAWEPSVCPVSGQQTRTCTLNSSAACNVNQADAVKPAESKSCDYEPVPCTLYNPDQKFEPGTVIHGGLPSSLQDECPTRDGRAECQADGTWKLLACYREEAPTNNNPSITVFNLPASVAPSTVMNIPVTSVDNDAYRVSKLELLDANNNVLSAFNCGNIATCSQSFSATAPATYSTSYTFKVKATDAAGLYAILIKSGITTSAPACVDTSWTLPQSAFCAGITFTQTSNCGSTRLATGIKSCPAPVVTPANNPPLIASFDVPSVADRNADITITVTATDADGNLDRIEILDWNNVKLAEKGCAANPSLCTRSFTVRVIDAFDAVYSFVARAVDSLNAAATASKGGKTRAAPVFHAPEEPAPSVAPAPEKALEDVSVKIPAAEIFVSTLVPDTGCVAPGADTFLYASLKNKGSKTVRDVKITAVVYELGIKAASGPFAIRKGGSASRFLDFAVPEDAEPGTYYIRVSVTSQKDSIVKYRLFEVNRAC